MDIRLSNQCTSNRVSVQSARGSVNLHLFDSNSSDRIFNFVEQTLYTLYIWVCVQANKVCKDQNIDLFRFIYTFNNILMLEMNVK